MAVVGECFGEDCGAEFGRENASLMEEPVAGAALGRASNFSSSLWVNDVAGDGVLEAGGAFTDFLGDQKVLYSCRGKGKVDDVVDALVAPCSTGFGERVSFGNEKSVGEVLAMVDDASAGGAFDELEFFVREVGRRFLFGLKEAVANPVAGP